MKILVLDPGTWILCILLSHLVEVTFPKWLLRLEASMLLRLHTSLNAPRWSTQLRWQANSYISSFPLSSSTSILMKTFVMTNPPLSSELSPKRILFHAMGNPYLGATPVWDKFYNPHKPVNCKSYAKNQRKYANYLNNNYPKKCYEAYSRNQNNFRSLSNEVEWYKCKKFGQ